MNNFDIADVRIDTFIYYMPHGFNYNEGYRMTHKPTGAVVLALGAPRISNKQKTTMMDVLKETVKNDASFSGKDFH